ncbi:TPA: hypothetical protein N0F65_009228 [Lagenidium giganteum]|uniref:Uncharacterized protein n=1 Tax=Lagenidium giganteum TaxID=4803 RepID=A0AAV2YNX1_9STRA|nr:TPA: hypothetical protein N0F65_009228 [Lagenidium giganteum]
MLRRFRDRLGKRIVRDLIPMAQTRVRARTQRHVLGDRRRRKLHGAHPLLAERDALAHHLAHILGLLVHFIGRRRDLDALVRRLLAVRLWDLVEQIFESCSAPATSVREPRHGPSRHATSTQHSAYRSGPSRTSLRGGAGALRSAPSGAATRVALPATSTGRLPLRRCCSGGSRGRRQRGCGGGSAACGRARRR